MALISYNKPYLSVPNQIELLRARGMLISDSAKAETCLRRIGYYRLSGYAYPFRSKEVVQNQDGSESERVFESFRRETKFSQVMDLYVFDKKLRLLFLDAVERVEIAIRVEIALVLGQYGYDSHRNSSLFNSYFTTADPLTNETPHNKFLSKLDEAFERSREEFSVHFRSKYSSHLPIWMSIELWDFGALTSILAGMKDPDLDQVSAAFDLPRRRYLISWSQSINFVRNICAHHGRLWNRPLVQQPAPPRAGDIESLRHLSGDELAKRRVYAVAACLQYLMGTVHPASTWSERLKTHLATLPKSAQLSLRHMGFPDGWEGLPLWTRAAN